MASTGRNFSVLMVGLQNDDCADIPSTRLWSVQDGGTPEVAIQFDVKVVDKLNLRQLSLIPRFLTIFYSVYIAAKNY